MEIPQNYIIGISHIALIVQNIEKAWEQFNRLGFTEDNNGGYILDDDFGLKVKVIRQDGYVVELLEAINEKGKKALSPASGEIRYELGHVCYVVSDIEAQIAVMKKSRFVVTTEPSVSKIWNKRIAVLANRKMGLVELIENK